MAERSTSTVDPPPGLLLSPRRTLWLCLAFPPLYVAVDRLVTQFGLPPSGIIPWYPPAGLGLAMLLVAGIRLGAPLLFVSRVVASFFDDGGVSAEAVAGAAVITATYAVAAWHLAGKLERAPRCWSVVSVSRCTATVTAAAVLAGLTSALAQTATDTWGTGSWWHDLVVFWVGDVAGILLVLPLVVVLHGVWSHPGDGAAANDAGARGVPLRLLQAAAIVAAVLAATSFHSDLALGGLYLTFVPLVWITLTDGFRGAVVAASLISTACVVVAGFVGVTDEQVLELAMFLVALHATGLFMGATVTMRHETEAQLQHLFDTAAEGILRTDDEGRAVYANRALGRLLGRDPDEMLGRPAAELVPAPSDRRSPAATANGGAAPYEARLAHADGREVRLLVHGSESRSVVDGRVTGALTLVTDVTGLRRAERERDVAVAVLEAAFRRARDAMILFRGEDEIIVDVNDAWCRVTGYDRDDVIGRSQLDLDIWGDPADSERMRRAVREHGSVGDFFFTFHRRLPNGRVDDGEAVVSAYPVELEDTEFYLVIGRDVTQERRLAAQRRQTQRLEELGRLAGGVAHDFNNLLTVMRSYAQMALLEVEAGRVPPAAHLDQIVDASGRAAEFARRLLAFSRSQVLRPTLLDLSEVVRQFEGVLAPLLRSDVVVRMELADDLPPVHADRAQVEQVLLNLAVNARDAMPDGGELTFRTEALRAEPGTLHETVGPDAVAGDYLRLVVEDTGTGIAPEVLDRIFEPFFTTKEKGRGTGLGLSLVYGVVRQSGGSIRAESVPGEGTRFLVFWPAGDDAAAPAPEPAPPAAAAADDGAEPAATVVVVEDDRAVLRAVAEMLRRIGHRVVAFPAATEALEHLTAGRDGADVVLSDVVMPRMNGHQLARRLAELRPELPVVLMSGYDDTHEPGAALPNVAAVLSKPLEIGRVRDAIGDALARAASREAT